VKAPRFSRTRRARSSGIGAVAAAWVALALWLGWSGASRIDAWLGPLPARMSASAITAMLSAVASGMIAFTGVVFSLAFVGLQFGSSTYGPRFFAELGGGRSLAHAVGVFTGTFVFALMAIHAVDVRGGGGVPLSIPWLSLAWLLASVGVAVLLLPRVARLSIGSVLAEVGERGCASVARVYRSTHDETATPPRDPRAAERWPHLHRRRIMHHGAPMYVVGLHVAQLVDEARRVGGLVEVPHRIGGIVEPGDALAVVHAAGGSISERRIRRAVWLGVERRTENDPAYALRLLVDAAIRALSPAVNDPTTAVDALDRIQAILAAMGRARLDVGRIVDDAGAVRVVFRVPTWDDLVELGLSEIAQYGHQSGQVQARLRRLVDDLVDRLDSSRRAALVRVVCEAGAGPRRRSRPRASLAGESFSADGEHEAGLPSAADTPGSRATTTPTSRAICRTSRSSSRTCAARVSILQRRRCPCRTPGRETDPRAVRHRRSVRAAVSSRAGARSASSPAGPSHAGPGCLRARSSRGSRDRDAGSRSHRAIAPPTSRPRRGS
jgi:uncharacterized membrane protein